MRIDVEKKDFAKLLPSILATIDKSDFIAFDTELSGLCSHKSNKYFQYDDPQDRYSKLRSSVQNFGLLQFGLGCFYSSSSSGGGGAAATSGSHTTANSSNTSTIKKKKFDCKVYGFYVSPHLGPMNVSGEKMMTIQLSSFQFLAENNFDFNKAFKDPISFMSKNEEKVFRDQKMQQASNSSNATTTEGSQSAPPPPPVIKMRPDEQVFIGECFKSIQEWLNDNNNNNGKGKGKGSSKQKKLELPPCNSFMRMLLYQKIPLKFGPDVVPVKRQSLLDKKEVGIDILVMNEKERQEYRANEIANMESQLQEAIGFRKIIDHIIEKKKPIVGHNCWLDLCHIFDKFIGPLPESIHDFLSILSDNFPVIYDTKHLYISKFKNSQSLQDINDMFRDNELPLGTSGSMGAAQFHDAAWDAYCTGRIFIGLSDQSKPEVDESSGTPVIVTTADSRTKSNLAALREGIFNSCQSMFTDPPKHLINHIHIMQSDYEHLNLKNIESGKPERKNLMAIYGVIPENITTSKLQEIIRKEGNIPMGNGQIMWSSHCQLPDAVIVFDDCDKDNNKMNDIGNNGNGMEEMIMTTSDLPRYNNKTITIDGKEIKLLWWPEWIKTKNEKGLPSKRHYKSSS